MSMWKTLLVVATIAVVVLSLVGIPAYTGLQEGDLHARMITPIPEKVLKNMTVPLGTRQITFLDGKGADSTDEQGEEFARIGPIAYGDYDHDGWVDAAMLIQEVNGPTVACYRP